MDAQQLDRALKIIKAADADLGNDIDALLGSLPRLRDGSAHDPARPVYHPESRELGFPPLTLHFSPSRGFTAQLVTLSGELSAPTIRRVPASECFSSIDDCVRRPRPASGVEFHRNPAPESEVASQSGFILPTRAT